MSGKQVSKQDTPTTSAVTGDQATLHLILNPTSHENQQEQIPQPKFRRKPVTDPELLPSHEAFIEALKPIPIDSIIENDRKCPHCWRIYGEPDPGKDNAEDPVRLPCGHEFGEQCALSLYQLPDDVTVVLCPISFEEGSRGMELGDRLSQYLKDEASAGEQSKSVDTPTKRTSPALRVSARLKGKPPGEADSSPAENSVKKVFTRLLTDLRRPSKRPRTTLQTLGNEWYGIFQSILSPNHTLRSVYFLENGVIYDVEEITSHHHHHHHHHPGDYPYFSSFAAMGFDPWMEPMPTQSAATPALSSIQQAVASQVAQTASLGGHTAELVENEAAIMTAVGTLQQQMQVLDGLVKNEAGSAQTVEIVQSMEDLKAEMLELKSKADKVSAGIASPASSNAAPASSSMSFSAAALDLASTVSAPRRNRQDETQKRTDESIAILASALVGIHNEYRKRVPEIIQPLSSRSSSSSPPLKKQKPSTFVGSPNYDILRKQVQVHVRVHTKGLETKHYDVIQPHSYFDDYSDDEDEEQVSSDHGEASFIIMRRSICDRACCAKDSHGKSIPTEKRRHMKADIPLTIGWKDVKNVPSDCPKCRRLLFKKSRPSNNGDADGITAMHM
ncbi:hypothetical protein BDV96DRAFT_201393 [Lophiotrema nucula]|uniref:RING-type domain-containing protein n=1 Tax=Lophiotrema nucula TaxID=690887 RepID=A0A6A5YTP8_9PLEO|nr:hypothetical protein BDV96DRAFT_201393 [Lophiotrema nucula]